MYSLTFFSFFLPLLLFFSSLTSAQYQEPETGTLIVSYQTGARGERLNRVRFLLKNEYQEQQMYPKGSAFLEDPSTPSRKVVLDGLPVGKYTFKFLIPNADNLFASVPEQEIVISKNSVTKIDQIINPQYATVKAFSLPSRESAFESVPEITLKDREGVVRAHSTLGRLIAHYLPPGKYTLTFEEIPGYQAPDPVAIDLQPNEEIAPIVGIYQCTHMSEEKFSSNQPESLTDAADQESSHQSFGTLLLVVQTPDSLSNLAPLRFKMINEKGEERELLQKMDQVEQADAINEDPVILLQELPVGEYQLLSLGTDLPLENFTILDNQTTVVQQSISDNKSSKELAQLDIRKGLIYNQQQLPILYNQPNGYLTVNSNIPTAHWSLLRDNRIVYSGMGPVFNLQMQPGGNYQIKVEELEGFSVKVNPPYYFSFNGGDLVTADIFYLRTYGYLDIKGNFNDPDGFEVSIRAKGEQMPFKVPLKPKEGKLSWQSAPLPTGTYEISYQLPPTYEPMPSEIVQIRKGEHTLLRPTPVISGILHITANIPEAIYLLRKANNLKAWKGSGKEFIFKGLTPGSYILSFATDKPEDYIPPNEIRFNMNDFENKEFKVVYQFAGKLMINTNTEKSTVNIRSLSGFGRNIKEDIIGRSRSFALPEGRYRITFVSQGNIKPPEAVEIEIRPFRTEEITVNFSQAPKQEPENTGKLVINSNIAEAGFSIQKITESKKESIGHFTGKSVIVPLEAKENYEITFDRVPNYKTPDPITVSVTIGEQKTIQGKYTSEQSMELIPAGRAIIGDPNPNRTNELPSKVVNISAFSIGTYEVTNAQFAEWLNRAIRENKISYVDEADNRGQVVNLEGKLLFKTFESDPYSQISAQPNSVSKVTFMPLAGKDTYPVINVSWYGAKAFCQDHNCRLPSEAEWEKAAGMAPEKPNEPLKKFKFGFGRDTIDKSWANYKDNTRSIQYFQVLTTPVGFFNGTNLLPLSFDSKGQEMTNLAKSPYGAFDMSGNVWEWTEDWFDSSYTKKMTDIDPKGPETGTEKVAKGGCYDSLADGVRVAERMGLPLEYTDGFTGFRVASD